ncbi:MAG: PEP-CTERM sorting domain-containing protein [Phycisphaeraceae bacterium]|nr:PEP-CTERM sorting domain-containing protein [Phycisphaeraceae bacterium]
MSRLRLKHMLTVMAGTCVGMSGAAGAAVVDLTPGPDTVAQWQFASNLNATSTAPGVSASAVGFTFSPSNGGQSGGKGIDADGTSYAGGDPIQSLGEAAWSGANGRAFGRVFSDIDTHAFTFSITLDPGESIHLDSLVLDIGWRGSGPDHVRFAYSTDGFSTQTVFGEGQGFIDDPADAAIDFGDNGSLNVIRPASAVFSWNRYSADLGITATDTVDFRIYFGGATATNAEGNIFIDNVTLLIPEPASLALLSVGGLLLLRRRP